MAAASYAGRVFVFIIVVFKMAYVGVKVGKRACMCVCFGKDMCGGCGCECVNVCVRTSMHVQVNALPPLHTHTNTCTRTGHGRTPLLHLHQRHGAPRHRRLPRSTHMLLSWLYVCTHALFRIDASIHTHIRLLIPLFDHQRKTTQHHQAEPIQPQPQQLSATLLTLAQYIRPDMYDFNPANKWAPSDCRPAYALNRWFLIFQIMVVVLVSCILAVVVTCAVANYRIGKRWTLQLKVRVQVCLVACPHPQTLTSFQSQSKKHSTAPPPTLSLTPPQNNVQRNAQGNAYPLLLLLVAFGGYVTCFYAKETVAQLTLDVLRVREPRQRGRVCVPVCVFACVLVRLSFFSLSLPR